MVTEADLGTSFKNVASATAQDGTTGKGETPEIPVAPKPEPTPEPEPPVDDVQPEPEPASEPEPQAEPEQLRMASPKTGDETPVALIAALVGIGASALMASAVLFVANRRRG